MTVEDAMFAVGATRARRCRRRACQVGRKNRTQIHARSSVSTRLACGVDDAWTTTTTTPGRRRRRRRRGRRRRVRGMRVESRSLPSVRACASACAELWCNRVDLSGSKRRQKISTQGAARGFRIDASNARLRAVMRMILAPNVIMRDDT